MDRLDAMRVFLRVWERRSFTAAADDLGIPRSTVTEAVKSLENRLGVNLLIRTTRVVSPTVDGERFYHRCRSVLADVDELEASFSEVPRGLLRVEVHGTLANQFLWPHLPDFMRRHPEIELRIGEGDRLVDLVREGVDCALRVGHLPDSDMFARQVALLEEITCASPEYLDRFGVPKTVADLVGHKMIGFYSGRRGSALPLEFEVNGKNREVTLDMPVTVVAAQTLRNLCLNGVGIAQMPGYHIADELGSGRLVSLLNAYAPPPTPVSILYPRNAQFTPRVRVFIDWVQEIFARAVDKDGRIKSVSAKVDATLRLSPSKPSKRDRI